MLDRVYNFSSGPAVLPESVLLKAQNEMLNYDINLKYSFIPLNISLNVVI